MVRRLLPVALVLLAGCGDPKIEQPTFPVTGTVTFDGKPVAGATLVFHPTDKSKFKWDERPQAKTAADGTFTVFTYKAGDGAPAGDYKVAVAVIAVGDDGDDQVKRVKGQVPLPAKFGSHETSGLTATVTPATAPLTFALSK